jgi:hypothetical protein
MIYRASRILGLEVHARDGPIGWVDEVFFDHDHSVRAILVELRSGNGGFKLLVGSSWIEAIEHGHVDLFLDRQDVRKARPHRGENVALDVVSLLPVERAAAPS